MENSGRDFVTFCVGDDDDIEANSAHRDNFKYFNSHPQFIQSDIILNNSMNSHAVSNAKTQPNKNRQINKRRHKSDATMPTDTNPVITQWLGCQVHKSENNMASESDQKQQSKGFKLDLFNSRRFVLNPSSKVPIEVRRSQTGLDCIILLGV